MIKGCVFMRNATEVPRNMLRVSTGIVLPQQEVVRGLGGGWKNGE